jgi:hypothetical protein
MANVPTMQELLAVIADLQAKNAAADKALAAAMAKREGVLNVYTGKPKLDKDGDLVEPAKGTVSVGGLNTKWPVTLYANQWEKLAAYIPTVLEYIKANDAVLNRSKGPAPRTFQTDAITGLAIPYKG